VLTVADGEAVFQERLSAAGSGLFVVAVSYVGDGPGHGLAERGPDDLALVLVMRMGLWELFGLRDGLLGSLVGHRNASWLSPTVGQRPEPACGE
jgi:hypothetical protein